MEDNNDIKFIDGESTTGYGDDRVTFKDIVIGHLRRITGLASVEWVGGYWVDRHQVIGNLTLTSREYISDSREVYANAVECLADLLAPYYDGDMMKAEQMAVKAQADKEKEIEKSMSQSKKKEAPEFIQQYREARVQIIRGLFRDLNKFLYRKKYLDMTNIDD